MHYCKGWLLLVGRRRQHKNDDQMEEPEYNGGLMEFSNVVVGARHHHNHRRRESTIAGQVKQHIRWGSKERWGREEDRMMMGDEGRLRTMSECEFFARDELC